MLEGFRRKWLIRNIGKDLLDKTEECYSNISTFLETLEGRQQIVCTYLYITKILSGFNEKERNMIINLINQVEWKKIE
jgi:hypothetical protein